jgi:hypothetical protein
MAANKAMPGHRPRTVVVVMGRNRPHEVAWFVVALVSGLGFLFRAIDRPVSVSALLPGWAVGIWVFVLFSSGLVGLVGAFWHGEVMPGLRLEQAGLLMGVAALLPSIVSAYQYAGPPATYVVATSLAFAGANTVRVFAISRTIRDLRRP